MLVKLKSGAKRISDTRYSKDYGSVMQKYCLKKYFKEIFDNFLFIQNYSQQTS